MPEWMKALAFWLAIGAGIALMVVALPHLSPAHSEGWDTDDPDLASWFATSVVVRCCDQRDAYLADEVDGDGENIIAIITDGSANERYSKPAIPNGTRIVVPKNKVVTQPPVPGGHGVIFISKNYELPPEQRTVYCYFPRWSL